MNLCGVGKINKTISDYELIHLHWDKKLTFEQIGLHFGYTQQSSCRCISQIFRNRGLPHRTHAEAMKLMCKLRPESRYKPKGDKHPQWKGGKRKTGHGYIQMKDSSERLTYEHRLVWEQSHNKTLPKGWVVHHLNGIRSDNRPENLVAMPRKDNKPYTFVQALQARIRELEQLHLPL